MLISSWHKTLRSTAFQAALWWMTAIYWPGFPTFTYPSLIWCPQWGKSARAIGFIFGKEKLEWLGNNLVKVAWWLTQSFGHNTSTWQTHRVPVCVGGKNLKYSELITSLRRKMLSEWLYMQRFSNDRTEFSTIPLSGEYKMTMSRNIVLTRYNSQYFSTPPPLAVWDQALIKKQRALSHRESPRRTGHRYVLPF